MYKLKKTESAIDDPRRKAAMAILREKDPKITAVLLMAPHVALYELLPPTGKGGKSSWQKSEIEGTLFLAESGNKWRIFIRNNQASDQGDFEQDIDNKVELEVVNEDNTVFYKVGNSNNVRGLWFNTAEYLDKFVSLLKSFTPPPPPPPAKPEKHHQDAGKALLAALGVQQHQTTTPVAPVAPPTRISAPPSSVGGGGVTGGPRLAPSEEEDRDLDAVSLLKEALAGKDIPRGGAGTGGVWVTKAELRLVLGELVMSDHFVNEVFSRLTKRQ